MHKEWKEELQELYLTTMQKERMKQAVYDRKAKTTFRFVPVVVPIFVAITLFTLWLGIGNSVPDMQTANTLVPNVRTQATFTKEIFIMTLCAQLLIGFAIGFSIIVSKKVQRLQYQVFWRFVAQLVSPKRIVLYVGITIFMMCGIVWLSFNLSNPENVLTWIILMGVAINIMMLQLFLTRKNERSCCPHCGEPIPLNQFLKITKVKCMYCDKKIYYSRKDSARSFVTYYLGIGIWMLIIPILDVSFWQVTCFIVPMILFMFTSIVPHASYYEKDEEDLPPPLW